MKNVLKLFALLFAFSCNDIASTQDEISEVIDKQRSDSDINARINTTPIPTYPLSWETIMDMPHPNLSIRAPWQVGASARISNDAIHDYKNQDGWELVYNTFSPTVASSTLFFALYNKYRGILRVYYFSKNDVSSIYTDYLKGTLILEGSSNTSSPILNFVSTSVVDASNKNIFGAVIIPFRSSTNTWFAFDFELAYDPNMASKTFSELAARLNIEGVNITSVNLNGTIDGELSGQVASSGLSLSVSPNFSGNTTNYVNSTIINGNSDADKLKIGTILKNGIKSGLTSGLAGLASNFLSGIFSKTTSNASVSKMTVDMNQTLTGTFTDELGIVAFSLPFTGNLSPIGNGSHPDVQGIFNLTGLPTIKVIKIHQRRLDSSGAEIEPLISYQYELVPGTLNVIWNPSVVPSLGSVSNQKNEVVVLDHASITYNGVNETSGSLQVTTGNYVKVGPEPLTPIGIRVSFKFSPSNGSNFVFNAKTFAANIISEDLYLPPGGGGGEDS
ncbi:MAG: hypothetical protein Q8S14_15870 [Algoriphagus sp.]|uniref:hypothetical protein n=1 Tax=Algoriphagus sp. TaxID=1872435 RepID=UPI002731EB7E|nr:hypothetical protein [Algoriphagus sp.]MDP2040595.1 hypothetical protein [Algoriphagus sp.]MDP3473345.1 hypothetical protein [Algoriphagus sp.]